MKKKILSMMLSLILCVGMAVPALAAETIPLISIAIPGIDGYTNHYDQMDVTGLTFTLEKAPSQYYFLDKPKGVR